jgi:hypothetical protein
VISSRGGLPALRYEGQALFRAKKVFYGTSAGQK